MNLIKKKISLIFFVVFSLIITSCSQKASWDTELSSNLNQLADSLTANLKEWDIPKKVFIVDEFGAIADSSTLNSQAIQKAIDSCYTSGGGTVLFPKGNYVTGTIELKSNVMLKIAKGARILASTNLKDYPEKTEKLKSIMSEYYEFRQSLIYAENVEKIGISGQGEIYFRGEQEHFPSPETIGKIKGRPLGIRMIECKNIVIKDILLRNSASWMQNYIYCKNLILDRLTVMSGINFNNDGIDIDGCDGVIVRNSFVFSGDDAMCFKGASNKPTQNILIENSTFLTTCNAFKIGTDTQGDFKNIIARNLILGGVPDSLDCIKGKEASTGITLATVDGGNVENIYLKDIEINKVRCPIFIRTGNRGRVIKGVEKPTPGYLKNIVIENVTGSENFRQGSLISGISQHLINNVIIKNMNISMQGGGTTEMANASVDENEGGYPDAQVFLRNGLPSYGFYIRHAENIALENIKVNPINTDERPMNKSGGDIKNVVINDVAL